MTAKIKDWLGVSLVSTFIAMGYWWELTRCNYRWNTRFPPILSTNLKQLQQPKKNKTNKQKKKKKENPTPKTKETNERNGSCVLSSLLWSPTAGYRPVVTGSPVFRVSARIVTDEFQHQHRQRLQWDQPSRANGQERRRSHQELWRISQCRQWSAEGSSSSSNISRNNRRRHQKHQFSNSWEAYPHLGYERWMGWYGTGPQNTGTFHHEIRIRRIDF